ncbi:MAG: ribosome biogenesis GTP-binding protein YihA/YsxC [Candidatus Symbiodolus clandestinus]
MKVALSSVSVVRLIQLGIDTINYQSARFILSAENIGQLPQQSGREVAFVGRSNAGKSSALNSLTNQKKLAKTSKLPGRTRLINLFQVAEQSYLVDLPGYGYAQVPDSVKQKWQHSLSDYLWQRRQLQGLVLLMDCRHPLKILDQQLIRWTAEHSLPLLIVLTKKDKLTHSAYKQQELKVQQSLQCYPGKIDVLGFSATKRWGIEALQQKLTLWLMGS